MYDDQQMGSDIYRSIQTSSEGADYLCRFSRKTESDQCSLFDNGGSLPKLALTLSRELFDRFSQTIVVDHHRRDEPS